VTIFTTGRAALFLMATFALFMEGVLGGRSLRFDAVTTGALAGFHAFVMAGLAVSHLALMGSVVESDFAHLVGELDFGRTVVGGNDHGADGEKRDGGEKNDKTFHGAEPPEKGLARDYMHFADVDILGCYFKFSLDIGLRSPRCRYQRP